MTMVSQSSTAGETVFKIPSGLEETREKKGENEAIKYILF